MLAKTMMRISAVTAIIPKIMGKIYIGLNFFFFISAFYFILSPRIYALDLAFVHLRHRVSNGLPRPRDHRRTLLSEHQQKEVFLYCWRFCNGAIPFSAHRALDWFIRADFFLV